MASSSSAQAAPPSLRPRKPRGRRPISPPNPPPRWGQSVAPPPTPFNSSPPEAVAEADVEDCSVFERPLQSTHRRHKCGRSHHHRKHHHHSRRSRVRLLPRPDLLPDEEHQVVTYAYRFSGQQILRDDFLSWNNPWRDVDIVPPPNSQSSSPVFTATTGSSPENVHPTSPVSPTSSIVPILRSSTSSNSTTSRKTVQWLSDCKRRPEDISDDRKVVKRQVSFVVSSLGNIFCIHKTLQRSLETVREGDMLK